MPAAPCEWTMRIATGKPNARSRRTASARAAPVTSGTVTRSGPCETDSSTSPCGRAEPARGDCATTTPARRCETTLRRHVAQTCRLQPGRRRGRAQPDDRGHRARRRAGRDREPDESAAGEPDSGRGFWARTTPAGRALGSHAGQRLQSDALDARRWPRACPSPTTCGTTTVPCVGARHGVADLGADPRRTRRTVPD